MHLILYQIPSYPQTQEAHFYRVFFCADLTASNSYVNIVVLYKSLILAKVLADKILQDTVVRFNHLSSFNPML